MTLNDLHAAQIEAIYFILLALGAYTFCLCMTRYICAKMVVEAITVNAALLAGEVSKQKVVVEVPVHDPTYWMKPSQRLSSATECHICPYSLVILASNLAWPFASSSLCPPIIRQVQSL